MSYALVAGIDGIQTQGTVADGLACCPPDLCNIDTCGFLCSFMAYMPKGPNWDHWKAIRYDQLMSGNDTTGLPECTEPGPCVTILDHAIYTARKLLIILQGPLQTAIWESFPLTAFNTRQTWLDNFGWSDCFDGPNANALLGTPTPYQALCNAMNPPTICALEAGDPDLFQMSPSEPPANPIIDIEALVRAACPPDLLLAVQYGILLSLCRLQLGISRNLESINFILAPLGAQIAIQITDPQIIGCAESDCAQMSGTPPNCVMQDDANQMTGATVCTPFRPCMNVILTSIPAGTIAAGPGITTPLTCAGGPLTTIPASYAYSPPLPADCNQTGEDKNCMIDCNQMVSAPLDCPTIEGAGVIWPGVMAAECILFSLLPTWMNYKLIRAT